MSDSCHHIKFILFVTGKGEEAHLPLLFQTLTKTGICSFAIGARIPQLAPVTSTHRQLKMKGSGKQIPDKTFNNVVAPIRRYLLAYQQKPNPHCLRVLLIDDLEKANQDQIQAKFDRYRQALDLGLGNERKQLGSVHFLVNMLEAYFFADINALNEALGLTIVPHNGDVESIPNPKSKLKKEFKQYNEITDAEKVLQKIDLATVLADPNHCASLRTCIKWIVEQLTNSYSQPSYLASLNLDQTFHLKTGHLYKVTAGQ